MMQRRMMVLGALCVPALAWAQTAAQSTAATLDRLFAALKAAETTDAANLLTEQIVEAWLKAATPAALLLMQRGGRNMEAEVWGDATDDFTAAIDLSPDCVEAWFGRAQAYAGGGQDGGCRARYPAGATPRAAPFPCAGSAVAAAGRAKRQPRGLACAGSGAGDLAAPGGRAEPGGGVATQGARAGAVGARRAQSQEWNLLIRQYKSMVLTLKVAAAALMIIAMTCFVFGLPEKYFGAIFFVGILLLPVAGFFQSKMNCPNCGKNIYLDAHAKWISGRASSETVCSQCGANLTGR